MLKMPEVIKTIINVMLQYFINVKQRGNPEPKNAKSSNSALIGNSSRIMDLEQPFD